MEIDVRCEGLEELLKRLERMGRNTEPVLERALERGAKGCRLRSSLLFRSMKVHSGSASQLKSPTGLRML